MNQAIKVDARDEVPETIGNGRLIWRVTWMCTSMLWLVGARLAHGQQSTPGLTFDVASIKLTEPDKRDGGIKPLPGGYGYFAKNIPVKLMISLMYRVPMRQIMGGPEWLNTEKYDILAKADHAYSVDDLHIMFQNLLAARFGLKFHIETKEGPVYTLTVDKPGLKMKENGSEQDFEIPMNFGSNGVMVGKRVPMPYLCWWLGQQLQQEQRPVVDATGLKGNYDFTLLFAPPLPPDVAKEDSANGLADRPSLFEAAKEQLGLRLVPQKGPVQYLVIDGVERPTAN